MMLIGRTLYRLAEARRVVVKAWSSEAAVPAMALAYTASGVLIAAGFAAWSPGQLALGGLVAGATSLLAEIGRRGWVHDTAVTRSISAASSEASLALRREARRAGSRALAAHRAEVAADKRAAALARAMIRHGSEDTLRHIEEDRR